MCPFAVKKVQRLIEKYAPPSALPLPQGTKPYQLCAAANSPDNYPSKISARSLAPETEAGE